MSLLLGLEPLKKFAVVVMVGGGGGGGWSKGILEFRFGPNLGLRLEAWTKRNKNHAIYLFPSLNGGYDGKPKFVQYPYPYLATHKITPCDIIMMLIRCVSVNCVPDCCLIVDTIVYC